MALITEKDIESLQEKKSAGETHISETKEAFDKADNELSEVLDKLKTELVEVRGENPNTLESLNSLIKDFEAKLLIPGKVRQEIDPTGISSWGGTVYEIIDNDFVNDNEDDWTATRTARDKSLKELLDEADNDIGIKVKDIVKAISDEEDGEKFDKGYNSIKSSYEAAVKATTEHELAKIVKENAEELLTKFIKDKVDNSPLVKLLEEQRAIRKNHAKITLINSERITPLIKNVNTGLASKLQDFVDDSEIFIKDIEEELGFDDKAKEVTDEVIDKLKDSESIFVASKAFDLTRDSLFNLETAGINKAIKSACAKGKTSISFNQKDITAMQLIALSRSGYKITHDEKSMPGMIPDEMTIIIDWGFVAEAS